MPLRIWHSIRFQICYLIKFIWLRIRVETWQKLAEPPNSCSLKIAEYYSQNCRDGSIQIVTKFPRKIYVLWKNSKELLKSPVKKSTRKQIRLKNCEPIFAKIYSAIASQNRLKYPNSATLSPTQQKNRNICKTIEKVIYFEKLWSHPTHTHTELYLQYFLYLYNRHFYADLIIITHR